MTDESSYIKSGSTTDSDRSGGVGNLGNDDDEDDEGVIGGGN